MIIQTLISSFLLVLSLFCPQLSGTEQRQLEFSFIPPPSWKIVPPKESPYIGFVGPPSKGFAPSINYRAVDITLDDSAYIEGVVKRHLQKGHQCLDLGSLPLENGSGHLLQIEQKRPFGSVRIWQLIVISQKKAHLLTCVSLSDDFSSNQRNFKNLFDSIKFIPDLLELGDKKKLIEMALDLKKDKKMLKFLHKHYAHLGPFWQAQCLAKLHNMGCLE